MHKRPSFWDEESLFHSGDDYFRELLLAIDKSKSTIEFETYRFEGGVIGRRVSEALIRAARRGVKVRLIIDGWGSPGFSWSLWPELKAGGVKVRFFRVSPHILTRLPGDPRGFWQRWLQRWKRVNRGDHRKFCLIDHTELWAGSFNVSDVHLNEVSGDETWKDIGVRLRGSEVRYARRAFQRAYRGWTALNFPSRSPHLLLLNDSFIHKRRARLQIIQRMRQANARIWLATPYFVPVGSVYRKLVKKAKRGVDVRLMVPQKNDVWFMRWLSWPILHDLAKKGVKIYIYRPRFSHQKIFIIDDWICIGSTNLNHRSFLHDLEMDVVLTHRENKTQVVNSYESDQLLSSTYNPEEWTKLPRWKRFICSVFLLAKYWT